MGVFGVFFGCRGATGFNGCCSRVSSGDGGFTLACVSGCRGVIGFKAATLLRPVREIVLPARSQHPKFGVFGLAGRVFRGWAVGGACWVRCFAPTGSAPGVVATRAVHVGGCGGFAALGAGWGCVAGVSDL